MTLLKYFLNRAIAKGLVIALIILILAQAARAGSPTSALAPESAQNAAGKSMRTRSSVWIAGRGYEREI